MKQRKVKKKNLHNKFTSKDIGYAIYFLGLEFARFPNGTYTNQCKYVLDILKDAGCLNLFLPVYLKVVSLCQQENRLRTISCWLTRFFEKN